MNIEKQIFPVYRQYTYSLAILLGAGYFVCVLLMNTKKEMCSKLNADKLLSLEVYVPLNILKHPKSEHFSPKNFTMNIQSNQIKFRLL